MLKSWVSRKKRRFVEDGYNLDLSCIHFFCSRTRFCLFFFWSIYLHGGWSFVGVAALSSRLVRSAWAGCC